MEERERAEIAIRLIADADFSDAFQEAQQDLLDDFAADLLPAEEASRVRQAIEANEPFARAAQMAIAFRLASRHPGPAAKPVARFRVPYWAVAACALLIAGGVAGGIAWRHLLSAHVNRAPMASIRKTEASLAAPVIANTATAPGPKQQDHQAPSTLVATLVLPEGTRSGTVVPLQLQRGVQSIHIEWPVSADVESGAKLRLAVLQDSKQIAWFPEATPRRKAGGVPVALFLIPAGRVESGRYIFRVTSSIVDANETPLTELEVEVGKAG
jgi:hypothetical protein